jgi:hypothetical protein
MTSSAEITTSKDAKTLTPQHILEVITNDTRLGFIKDAALKCCSAAANNGSGGGGGGGGMACASGSNNDFSKKTAASKNNSKKLDEVKYDYIIKNYNNCFNIYFEIE